MFPLAAKIFPATAPDLAQLLSESLQRIFITAAEPVTIASDSYPTLQSLRISLDDAELRPSPPRPPVVSGERSPALQVSELRLEGSRLSLGPATADLQLTARDVVLEQGRDAQDEIVLVLRSAADGQVSIATDKSELEKAIAAVATIEAGKQGVTIENVRLILQERGPRSLSGEVQVKAKKLFFSTVIQIAAQLDLDDELNATLSGLACKGDGTIGTLACSVLAPHLQKIDGRTFSLMALPLGDVRLRDVRLAAGDKITVQAEFGA
ncbi:MAG: hypothetical protein ABI946_10315 [Chthoniobacterales bacterium]